VSKPRRKAAAAAGMLATFALGMLLAVFVVGSASAAGSKTPKKTAKSPTASVTMETTTTSPADSFMVINGTVNAASDHEIVGSSAFPNFTTGAVDNYYSLAHSHVDNSPFAEGTASPFDTGPIGQTAAAGNTQQPQYADARWPGDSGKAEYGNQGGPHATAEAGNYRATADASEASSPMNGPSAPKIAMPKGFDLKLRQALAGWKATWGGRLGLRKAVPPVSTPVGTVTVPKPAVPKTGVTVPKPKVTAPAATVTTPIATVTTPLPVSPTPTVTVPPAPFPSQRSSAPASSRSLASASASDPPPADGLALLTSSTRATLEATGKKAKAQKAAATSKGSKKKKKEKSAKSVEAKADTSPGGTLVTSGESSVGRVSLGGGQIVIEGIHVTASITNDGTPSYKSAVSVASATIGGVPVTIDQEGVHVAGQGQGIPYQQATDALNGALKQAGIKLFLVGPEVTTCGQSGSGDSGTDTTTTTTTTSSNQSSTGDSGSSCDQAGASSTSCDQSGAASGPATPIGAPPTTPGSNDQSSTTETTSSCDQTGASGMCDQAGTTTTTSTSPTPALGAPGTTTTSSRNQSGTTTTTGSRDHSSTTTTSTDSSCGGAGFAGSGGSCSAAGTNAGTTTNASDQTGTAPTPTTGSADAFGFGAAASQAGEMTVTATGVHVVFTQPVSPPGVPSQYVEHILGEVYVDSLATPQGPLPDLGLSSASSFSSSPASSSCAGAGQSGGATSGASAAGGGLSAGSASSGTASASGFGSSSQPGSGSGGTSLPVAFATALRKPLWLLLAYLVWQALVIGTGWSLWNWRREDQA
jgi:hypothetical protein